MLATVILVCVGTMHIVEYSPWLFALFYLSRLAVTSLTPRRYQKEPTVGTWILGVKNSEKDDDFRILWLSCMHKTEKSESEIIFAKFYLPS